MTALPGATADVDRTRSRARVVGVDLARCLALVGMMATHVLPTVQDGRVPLVHQVAAGRSSTLFAVLAGLSLTLVAGTRRPLRGRAWSGMLAGTAVRAAWIALIGLLLGAADTGIAVILVYYAVLFVVVVPFLALRTPVLLAVAAAWLVVAPLASQRLRAGLPLTSYAVPSPDSLAEPLDLLRDLLLTGYYPVLTWVPYLLVGAAVGRADLRSWRTTGVLLATGGLLAATATVVSDRLTADPDVRRRLIEGFEGAGWLGGLEPTLARGLFGVAPTGSDWWLAVRAPHTGTSFDLALTLGSALMVVGVCLPLGRLAPRLLGVLGGAGAMTLTLYTLHVASRTEGLWDEDGAGTYLGQVALVLAIGAAFRLAATRGPFEALVGETSRAARQRVVLTGTTQ